MLKQLFSVALISTLSFAAFAQEGATQTSQAQFSIENKNFSEYLMNGVSVGLEYGSLSADGHFNLKSLFTGQTTTVDLSTDRDSAGAGMSMFYGYLPRGGFGVTAGVSFLKSIESTQETGGYVGSGGEIRYIRTEMNAALSAETGLYGAFGGHLSHIAGAGMQDVLEPLGIGLQAQLGFVAAKSVALDVGYYISRHSVKETAFNGNYIVDKNDSYFNFKQLRARVSYLF